MSVYNRLLAESQRPARINSNSDAGGNGAATAAAAAASSSSTVAAAAHARANGNGMINSTNNGIPRPVERSRHIIIRSFTVTVITVMTPKYQYPAILDMRAHANTDTASHHD